MNTHDLMKLSVKLFMENDVSSDVVKTTDTLFDVIDKVALKTKGSSLDFLIVIVDESFKAHAVITYRNLTELIEDLSSKLSSEKQEELKRPISEFGYDKKFPITYFVSSSEDNAQKVLDWFKADKTDIVIALDENGKYIGKIKRNPFVEKIKLLLN